MTTATKTRSRKSRKNRMPPSADVATIAGREFLIIPLDEYDDWYDDHLLGLLMTERMTDPNQKIVPFSEIEKRLDKKGK